MYTHSKLYVTGSRTALVIGNRYVGEGCELYGAKRDAEEVKMKLEKCNFTVSMHLDLNKKEVEDTFDAFLRKLKSKDDVIFYYSGHGLSYQGEQLLVPCNMEQPENEYQIKYKTFSFEYAAHELARYVNSGCKIIITDCCRSEYWSVLKGIGSRNGFQFNNVSINFDPNNSNKGDMNKGFLDVEMRNIVRMCAASSGQAAEAGIGNTLSYYTRALSNNILIPNQSIMDLNIKICSELEERNAKPEICFTAPGKIVTDFRFLENENE